MKVISGIEEFASLNCGGTAITVGSFDGIHAGHSSLLRALVTKAKDRALKSVVVSFTPHPRIALGRTEGLSILTSDREKAQLLEAEGVDILLLLKFDLEFSALSYEQFIAQHLIKGLNMQELIVGFNHQMGHDSGNFDQISHLANKYNFNITLSTEYSHKGTKVSSTTIREAIMQGDIEYATELLTHPYLMIGHSDKLGRVLFEQELKLIPPAGNYIALINGVQQSIEVDTNNRLWCREIDKEVEIKLIKRYE